MYFITTDVSCFISFLGVFAKFRKVTISFVMSVCLSICPYVRMEQLRFHRMDFREISYLSIYRSFIEKIEISLKSHNNNATLHKDLCTFMTISR